MKAFVEILEGWLAIAVIILIVWRLNRLHEAWTYRQHQRNLGRVPPRVAR